MNKQHIFNHLAALAALALLLGLTGCLPELPELQSESSSSPIQTPPAPTTTSSTAPTPIRLQPGQTFQMPTWTPFPTLTPRPTPTLRPGPTATAIPLRMPTSEASGVLLYNLREAKGQAIRWMSITTDKTASPVGDSTPYWSQLDFEPVYPLPSPDGRYILFLQALDAGGIPYVFDRQNGQVRPLFGNKAIYDDYKLPGFPFGWHPDGQRVLFWVDATVNAGLWLVEFETGERTIITLVDSRPQGATVSPDGQRVAYAIHKDEPSARLWISYADGSSPKMIPGVWIASLFSWSPDGTYILFLGGRDSQQNGTGTIAGNSPLWVLNSDTLELLPLKIPFIAGYLFDATWSPDSRYVAAVGATPGEKFRCAEKGLPSSEADSCRYQGTSIYIEDVRNSEVHQLAPGISPVWSPDGAALAFLSKRSGAPEIWIIRRDGTNLRQITSNGNWKSSYFVWLRPMGGTK